MSNMTNRLFETKQQLQELGVVMSDNEYSSKMLGKSSRYVSWLKATGHDPAIDAMVMLYIKLDDLHDKCVVTKRVAMSAIVDDMSTGVWESIRRSMLAIKNDVHHNEAAT